MTEHFLHELLPNPLSRYPPYQTTSSSSVVPNVQPPPVQMHPHGLGSLNHGTHFSHHQMQQQASLQAQQPTVRSNLPSKHKQSLQGSRVSGTSGPVRRRISRACDQCNQFRTKCDGQQPCARCMELELGCEYIREKKKRGKASRKDLAQQAASQAAGSPAQGGNKSDASTGGNYQNKDRGSENLGGSRTSGQILTGNIAGMSDKSLDDDDDDDLQSPDKSTDDFGSTSEATDQSRLGNLVSMDRRQTANVSTLELHGYTTVPPRYQRHNLGDTAVGNPPYGHGSHPPGFSDLQSTLPSQSPPNYNGQAPFRMTNSPMGYTMGIGASPGGWPLATSSPSAQFPNRSSLVQPNPRYPVLEPLVPHLNGIIPIDLACHLVDEYFFAPASAHSHPMSPYVLGFLFRKKSFMHPTRPRHCQPALLASMLWVAAQTSNHSFLTSVPSARSKTCQRLLELTVGLLRPLIHTSSGDVSSGSSPAADGVALGGLGVAMPGSISMDALTGESGPFGSAGCLDDVITYIHLAIVVSASEYKGASLRWWNAAWSLARELKLGRELPPGPVLGTPEGVSLENETDDEHDFYRCYPGYATEEDREERRRTWWLVYIVDRHLALCYNRPLFLLDNECASLCQPMDDTKWQKGEFATYTGNNAHVGMLSSLSEETSSDDTRPRGPQFECRGHGIFGYFLPLMTILGDIVNLHHDKNHPRFGIGFRPGFEWEAKAAEISRHLETFEQSLRAFENKHLSRPAMENMDSNFGEAGEHHGMAGDLGCGSARRTESHVQTQTLIVMAYSTHVVHVLHILLAGKWDPVNLLDDEDLWISSQDFITATGHAVSAAEAIIQILDYDPGLEFMPFFFGIYLLQGSFLLLLIADKLQSEASPSVIKACETIVRAHEACVSTLNTEYQRNFIQVMRSALAQVRGRVPEDLGELHQRRRELLALYRWTADGTGLAL